MPFIDERVPESVGPHLSTFHEPGEACGSVATDTVERVLTFFHTFFVDDGIDVRFETDFEKGRMEVRLSTAGLDLLEHLLREARHNETRRRMAADGDFG